MLTTAAGFFLASKGIIDFGLLISILLGVGLVIGSACVFNNYIDRDIDKLMKRTKNRALANQSITPANALLFGSLLGGVGFGLLISFTNLLTVGLGVFAMISYLAFYGLAKRRSIHGTLVGSIPGALPPVAGYTSVTGRLDLGALLLFLALVFWQMPHFYAIALFRIKDYKAASIPVLPIVKGSVNTKRQMLIYILLFIALLPMFVVFDYTSYIFLAMLLAVSFRWLHLVAQGFNKSNEDMAWARKIFGFSLLVLLSFSFMLSVDSTFF